MEVPLSEGAGAIDWVEEASIESFPASDARAWPASARGSTPPPASDLPSSPVGSGGLEAIAYHEAGHVVVGHMLGLQLLDTDLETDGEGGRGHTHFAHPGSWFQPRRGSLSARDNDLIERVLTTFMAGLAAESRLGHADPDGSGYDLDQSMREWVSYIADTTDERRSAQDAFVDRAASIIERPQVWSAIEAVASSLLRQGRLDGSAAAQIVVDALRPSPGDDAGAQEGGAATRQVT